MNEWLTEVYNASCSNFLPDKKVNEHQGKEPCFFSICK